MKPVGIAYIIEPKKRIIIGEPYPLGRVGDEYWQEEIVGFRVKEDGSTFYKEDFSNSLGFARMQAVERIQFLKEQKRTLEGMKKVINKPELPKFVPISLGIIGIVCILIGVSSNPLLGFVGWGIEFIVAILHLVFAIKY